MNRRQLKIILINLFCLLAFLTCQIVSASLAAPLYTGRAAKAWAGQSGERFAQLAVFFPYPFEFGDEKIQQTRRAVEDKLRAVSLESNDERNYYVDAWSAGGGVDIAGQRGNASATAIGVGGDFFLFHPLKLRSGSYISPVDIMRDRVVLDEELAWRLYGSVNLAGMEVIINGREFLIAGVISRERGAAFDKVYDGGAGLYMSYEALAMITEGQARIISYEIVLPDLVTGFAMETLQSAINDESLHYVSNTGRFESAGLFEIIGAFGMRGIQNDATQYPYWENANRFVEDWLALMLVLSIISMACPCFFAVFYGVKLIRFGYGKAKQLVIAQLKAHDDRAYKRYLEGQNALPGKYY